MNRVTLPVLILLLPAFVSEAPAQTPVVKQEQATVRSLQVTQEAGKVIYRVKPSDFSAGTKTSDVLNKIPTLSAGGDGSDIRIKGRIPAAVYIDGQPAPSGFLNTLPVSAVKSIEVIENPNASVAGDAEGGIVNIVLRKDARPAGGSVSVSGGLARPLLMGGGNYLYSSKKIFLLLAANGQLSQQRRDTKTERQSVLPGLISVQSSSRSAPLYMNTHADLYYKPDSTQQASVVMYANMLGAGSVSQSLIHLPADRIEAGSEYGFLNRFFGGTGEYKKQISKTHQYLLTGAYQQVQKLMNATNHETSVYNAKTGNRLTDTVNINTVSLQAVLLRKDKKRKIQEWENGLLFRYEKAADRYGQQPLSGESNFGNAANSNKFQTNKTIVAAYTQLKFIKKKLQFSTGLRAEYARQELVFPVTGKRSERHFANLFPTLSVLAPLKNNYNLQLNYAKRTRRPDITILSDFRYSTGRAQISTGNAQLLPELTDKLSVSVSRMNKGIFFDLSVYGFRKTKPLLERTLSASVDSSVFRIIDNFKSYHSGGASFSFTIPYRNIFSVNGSVYAEAFRLAGHTPLAQKNSGIITGGNISLSASFKKKISVEGYITYSNYTYEYQQITRNFPLAILSVKKTTLNDRLNIALSWMDILKTGFNRVKEYDDGFMNQLATETAHNNNFVLSLTMNFGKTPRNSNRQKALIAEDVRERKNTE